MDSRYDQVIKELKTSPKKWLITGVAGFIGSNLLETLLDLGQEVVGIDNFITGHQKNLDEVKGIVGAEKYIGFNFIEGDIRDIETCRQACEGVDYVLHQAALGSVPRSIEDPILTNSCNVTGYLNMLVAAKDARVKNFVFASSSSIYGDNSDLPKNENKTGEALSPYALTKQIDEMYAKVFFKNYQLNTVGLRYFNVFGPRQDPNGAYAAAIPKWVAALINEEEAYIYGDGLTSRDFCFIANVVQANILAATATDPEQLNQVYNVALNSKTSLTELFHLISENLSVYKPALKKRDPKYTEFRKGDIRHSQANVDKAIQLLGYEPQVDVKEGLERSLEWYINEL